MASISTDILLSTSKLWEYVIVWHRYKQIYYASSVRMSKKCNLDGDIYEIVDIPISELEGQKLAQMGYEGIYRLDNGNYLKAHEWIAQEWGDEDPEPLGGVYYDIFTSLSDDAIAIDGGVVGYDLHDTMADFNDFLASTNQGQITHKIGVVYGYARVLQ